MKIAWMISCYQNPENILYIVKTLYNIGEDSVFLHYDRNSSLEEFEYIKNSLLPLPQVFCYQKFRTMWGTVDIIKAEIFLGKQLLKKKIDYDYMINITGTTFPIKSLKKIRGFLKSEYPKSFIDTSPNAQLNLNADIPIIRLFTEGHLFNSTVSFANRLTTHKHMKQRIFFRRILNFIKKIWFKIFPSWPYLLSFPMVYRGFVHSMISKPHYDKILKYPKLSFFLYELHWVNASDEILFHTLLRNLILEGEIINNNYLYTKWVTDNGSPDTLEIEDIDLFKERSEFFARKIENIEFLKIIDKKLL